MTAWGGGGDQTPLGFENNVRSVTGIDAALGALLCTLVNVFMQNLDDFLENVLSYTDLTLFLAGVGGGGFISPSPGLPCAIAKQLEIPSRTFLTFKGHSLLTFCEFFFFGTRLGQVTRSV